MFCKRSLVLAGCLLALFLGACSTNPATGRQQFTTFMSPQQEQQEGAKAHQSTQKEYGFYNDAALQAYVEAIGRRVTSDTERPDILYKFYILDSPMVNAFALPGGYIYVSRGLLALAQSEAELAGVLAHETGHITARHTAERYSHSLVTSLGAAVLSAALDSQGANQVLNLGSDLYLKSYSRGQESEADSLGIRYLSHAGYDPGAMASFLRGMQAESNLQARLQGQGAGDGFSYFSTHPATAERVAAASQQAGNYPQGGETGHDAYLRAIDGLVYGDSARHGFVKNGVFYHPELGFRFDVPGDFRLSNDPDKVVATASDNRAVIFDMVGGQNAKTPDSYIRDYWLRGHVALDMEKIEIGGQQAATASFAGDIKGMPATIRVVAIAWGDGRYARFQIAIPQGTSGGALDVLKTVTYSFRRLSPEEVKKIKPYRIRIITAGNGDTAESLAERQSIDTMKLERFYVLNGLASGQSVRAGERYKIIGD